MLRERAVADARAKLISLLDHALGSAYVCGGRLCFKKSWFYLAPPISPFDSDSPPLALSSSGGALTRSRQAEAVGTDDDSEQDELQSKLRVCYCEAVLHFGALPFNRKASVNADFKPANFHRTAEMRF